MGLVLLPRRSRPTQPVQIPPAPAPELRPPAEFVRLSLWDETMRHGIYYATSQKTFQKILMHPQIHSVPPHLNPGIGLEFRGEGGLPERFARESGIRVMRGDQMRLFM